jgi:hypothetical protein
MSLMALLLLRFLSLFSTYPIAIEADNAMKFIIAPTANAALVEIVLAAAGDTTLFKTEPNLPVARLTAKANATSPPSNHSFKTVEEATQTFSPPRP